MVPGEGMKVRAFSALMRHSMAWPEIVTSLCDSDSGAPEAMRICSMTRSSPVIISVTGCSTCRRVFISMKANSPSS